MCFTWLKRTFVKEEPERQTSEVQSDHSRSESVKSSKANFKIIIYSQTDPLRQEQAGNKKKIKMENTIHHFCFVFFLFFFYHSSCRKYQFTVIILIFKTDITGCLGNASASVIENASEAGWDLSLSLSFLSFFSCVERPLQVARNWQEMFILVPADNEFLVT